MQQEAYDGLNNAGYRTVFAGQEDRVYPDVVLRADLIVSTPLGLAKLPRSAKGVRLLYTANTHVIERLSRQTRTAARWNLPFDEPISRQLQQAAYDAADYFLIAENDAGIANFTRYGIPLDRIYRYNNCVDTDVWTPTPRKHDVFSFVCWSSALSLRKGLPSLVKAWEQWYSGQSARLLLVGMASETSDRLFAGRRQGEVRPGLMLQLEGFYPQDVRAIDLVRSAHVGVFPTLDDAQPTALLEMASCALPMITTIESGVAFPETFCTYVTADDPPSLAAAFQTWFDRRDELDSAAASARGYIVEHHHWAHFRRRFPEILSEICTREPDLSRR